jgi:hypothetical protein
MKYEKSELIKQALEIITEEQCVTLEEVWLLMAIGKQTAYNHGLDQCDEIKAAVQEQKVKRKRKMRRNWVNSDNATLQIAEFKLCSNDDELDRLNTQRVNANLTVNKPGISLTFGAESDDNG